MANPEKILDELTILAIIGVGAAVVFTLWKLNVFKGISDATKAVKKYEADVRAKDEGNYDAGRAQVPGASNPVLEPFYAAGFDAGNALRHAIVDPLNATAGPIEAQVRASAPAAYDQGKQAIGLGSNSSILASAILQPIYAAGFSAGQFVRKSLLNSGITVPTYFGNTPALSTGVDYSSFIGAEYNWAAGQRPQTGVYVSARGA